jgi:hypothetical protein
MIKGGVLREFLVWYEATHGVSRLRVVAERLPEDLRAFLDPDQPLVKLLASSWYPSRLVFITLDTLTEGFTQADTLKLAYDSNRWVVKHSMSSVYRFALRTLATPEMYAKGVGRFWRQLHSTGQRHVQVLSPTSLESTISDWAGHHPALCTITIETMCALFEAMGKKEVRWSRTACVARGAKACVTQLVWV